jgi:hypothetical protein
MQFKQIFISFKQYVILLKQNLISSNQFFFQLRIYIAILNVKSYYKQKKHRINKCLFCAFFVPLAIGLAIHFAKSILLGQRYPNLQTCPCINYRGT